MTATNVSVNTNDAELLKIQNKITSNRPVLVSGGTGGDGLECQVARANGGTLDLIAHSKGGVLQFGNWTIDEREKQSHAILSSWGGIGFSRIRLLGCNTGYTRKGIHALRHLKTVLNIEAWGTTTPLYSRDFDANGIKDTSVDQYLDEVDNLQDPKLSAEIVASWFYHFDHLPNQSPSTILGTLLAEDRHAILHAQGRLGIEMNQMSLAFLHGPFVHRLSGDCALAPGLLAIPETESLVDVPGQPDKVFRISHFFDGAMVRVYTPAHPEGLMMRATFSGHVFIPL